VTDNSYPKNNRLISKDDFQYLRSGSRRLSSFFTTIYYKSSKNQGAQSRLGISVSKKNGNAVLRNRLKRITREFFRQSKLKNDGKDVLVVIHRDKNMSYEKFEKSYLREIESNFQKIGKI
jgi:ribonuclease P protein component